MVIERECYYRLFKWVMLILVTTFLVLLIFEHPAFASWADTDSAIYHGGTGSERKNDVLDTLSSIYLKIKDIASDLLGSMFADMIVNAGDSLYYLISFAGLDINAIVYGRINGAAFMNNGISLFTFELAPGNPYGIVASYMYGAVRMIFILILVCIITARFSAYLYGSGGGRQREKLKESISLSLILFLMLILMPYILGVFIYLRDVILYVQMITGGNLIQKVSESIYPDYTSSISTTASSIKMAAEIFYSFFGSTGKYSIITMFREAAGGNLLNSLMYLGAVILTIYFAFAYIAAALSLVVLFVSFPMACIATMFDRTIMKSWLKQVLGILIIPILDSTLLIIPIFFGVLGKSQAMSGYTIVQFILCCCIIPARGCMRMWLGLGANNGMELAGIGALMGVMQLGKAVTGAAMGITLGHMEGKKSEKSDEERASMFSEMQKTRDFNEKDSVSKLDDDISDLFGSPAFSKRDEDKNKEQSRQGTQNFENAQEEQPEATGAEESNTQFGGQPQERHDNGQFEGQHFNQSRRSAFDSHTNDMGRSGGAPAAELRDKIAELDKRKAVLTDGMKKNDVRLAQINKESALLDEDNALLKAEREEAKQAGPMGQEQANELGRRISENDIARKSLASESADLREDNSIKSGQISRIDTASKFARDTMISAKAAGGGFAGASGTPGDEQAILDRYATIDNFETPDFKNISMDRKSELYRERARATRNRTQMQTILGASGAVAGATLAVGTSMFSNPAAKMYSIATGINAGVGLANLATEVTVNRQAQTGDVQHTLRDTPAEGSPDRMKPVPPSGETMIEAKQPQLGDMQGPVKRITQKQAVSQEVQVENELLVSTEFRSGQTTKTFKDEAGSGDTRSEDSGSSYQWSEGEAFNEKIWNTVISNNAGRKVMTTEVRRAMTTASSNARSIKRMLDADPGRSREEKNDEILENAVSTFSNEFSYGFVNSAAIPEKEQNGFDPENYQSYLKRKIKKQATNMLREKLKSLGLLY